MDPLNTTCPHCHAAPGELCVTAVAVLGATYHLARVLQARWLMYEESRMGTIDNCYECGHSIYAHSGRPDKENDACTHVMIRHGKRRRCSCPRMVRLVIVIAGQATIGTSKRRNASNK